MMAQYNSCNGTGKPIQNQNDSGTSSKDSSDKETNNADWKFITDIVHGLWVEEVINI